MADFAYRRLPGGRRGVLRGASLWLGTDHLLAVKNVRFSEEYRRYYISDIQALILRKAPRFGFSVWVVGGFGATLLGALILYFTRYVIIYNLTLVLIWVLVGYMAFISFFCSCVCHVQTAVSLDELPSLHRLRSARKAIGVITEQVNAVQGSLSEDWVPQLEAREALMIGDGARTIEGFAKQNDELRSSSVVPVSCWLAVLSMFAGAAIDWWQVGAKGDLGRNATYLLFLGSLIATATALVQTLRRRGMRAIRILMIVFVGFLGVELYTSRILPTALQGFAAAQGAPSGATQQIESLNQVTIWCELLLGVVGTGVLLTGFRETSG